VYYHSTCDGGWYIEAFHDVISVFSSNRQTFTEQPQNTKLSSSLFTHFDLLLHSLIHSLTHSLTSQTQTLSLLLTIPLHSSINPNPNLSQLKSIYSKKICQNLLPLLLQSVQYAKKVFIKWKKFLPLISLGIKLALHVE
jgi:hypothetical protein